MTISRDGSACEALLARALPRGPVPCGGQASADLTLPELMLPEVQIVAALAGDRRHWRLDADAGSSRWQDHVVVTASGNVDASAWRALGGLDGLGPHGFAQGGLSDGMHPGPLLEVLTEQAITASPPFRSVAGRQTRPARAAAAAAASVAAGPGSLAGIPGISGADGVRQLTDDELLGAMSAAQRLRNRAEWLELAAIAELARRRYAEQETSIANGDPVGQRAGEFAAEEIAYQTVCSGRAAGERMDLAEALAVRLPATCARIADGAIGSYKAAIIHRATRDLSAGDAATADAILAEEAPSLTPEALRRRALRVAMTLDPSAAEKRKRTGSKHKRVEMWAEDSGNAALAGREMDPADALAATAYYDALARALRKGTVPGTLRELRHLAFTDLNTGRDPLDRIAAAPKPQVKRPEARPDQAPPRDPREPEPEREREREPPREPDELRDDGYREDEPGGYDPWFGPDPDDDNDPHDDSDRDPGGASDDGGPDGGNPGGGNPGGGNPGGGNADDRGPGGADPGGSTAPAPASINVVIPVGTLLGWSSAPGEASRLGPLTPRTAQDLIQAASRHPGTRWCVTFTGSDGTAVAHGCSPGRHSWTPAEHAGQAGPEACPRPGPQTGHAGPASPDNPDNPDNPDSDASPAARVSAFLDWLGVTPEPIARGSCDHRHQEDRYTPSRKLAHLVRARTATCSAPGCGARAEYNDLDHTVSWPEGPSDECNLSPPCRHHHRVKQARGWKLEQVAPGIMRWTAPSGRSYTTRPTVYDTGDYDTGDGP